jgi:hypothetical protein
MATSGDQTASWIKWIIGGLSAGILTIAGLLYAQDLSITTRMGASEQRIAALEARQEEQFNRVMDGIQRVETKIDDMIVRQIPSKN